MTSLMSETNRLTFRETDEAGNPTATYIYSGDVASSITASKTPAGRVDVIHWMFEMAHETNHSEMWSFILSISRPTSPNAVGYLPITS
ncbi:unnamed protein product [Penicillium discolor]